MSEYGFDVITEFDEEGNLILTDKVLPTSLLLPSHVGLFKQGGHMQFSPCVRILRRCWSTHTHTQTEGAASDIGPANNNKARVKAKAAAQVREGAVVYSIIATAVYSWMGSLLACPWNMTAREEQGGA